MLCLSFVCEWGVGEVGHVVRDLEVLLCPFPLGNKSCPVEWTKLNQSIKSLNIIIADKQLKCLVFEKRVTSVSFSSGMR